MNFNNCKQKNCVKTEEKNMNKERPEPQTLAYSYYSNILKKPFHSVSALKEAEAAYYAELKAKEDKTAQKKADAMKVEDAFKMLNNARKVYKETMADLTTKYTEDLKKLKAAFEKDKTAISEVLAKAEESYSAALKTFTDKYPEGYHLTLKDGDFETTISSQTSTANRTYPTNTIGEILDLLFNF
jgi:hypothetical protein